MQTQWFYADGQDIKGPLSEQKFIEQVKQNIIQETTLVMAQGMSEWQLFRDTELYQQLNAQHSQKDARSFISSAAERINEMTGEAGSFSLNLSTLFSNVFKKHTKEESERIFIAGTAYTTPDIADLTSDWPKPWLFSRIFLSFVLIYALLFLCLNGFSNIYALPGLILIGSFAVPFSLVIFFFETNVPRNISIFSVVEMFFVGGVSAMFLTLVLYSIVHVNNLTVFSAVIIGLIEETGKLFIAAWFIREMNARYLLNGLLIGAVVGAGFAAFESAGYALSAVLTNHTDLLYSLIDTRAWTSIGSHAIWTAIAAAGLLVVKKERPFRLELLRQRQFLQFFAVAVLLHALWDMPLFDGSDMKLLFLIACGWFFVFVLMNSGLRQINRIVRKNQGLR